MQNSPTLLLKPRKRSNTPKGIKPRLFLEYAGVKVYHAYKDRNPLIYWYSLQGNIRDYLDIDELDFDVRCLPEYDEALDQDIHNRNYHTLLIRQAIEAGVIPLSEERKALR